MTLFLELTQEDFVAANRIVSSAEMECILLERCSAAVSPSYADNGRKLPPIELAFLHRAIVSDHSPRKLRIRVSFRLRGREENSDSKPTLALSATFVSEYAFPAEIEFTAKELQAFADANGIMTCWPYWREFVQSNIARMALPPLTLPYLKIRRKSEAKVANGTIMPQVPEPAQR